MSWKTAKLGDVLTLKRGYDLPNRARQPGDVPIVSSSGITGSHNEVKVKAPGVVTGRYGTLGEVFYITEDFWPLNTALYVLDFKGNNPRWVSYFLRQVLRRQTSDKAAVPGINRNDLHARTVRYPDRDTQARIANILSAYDDLIENNRRRIQLLEQAARLLYKEWFVHFRFPGHEHVKIKDGIPEGWEKKPLGEIANITMGQSPKSKYYNEDGVGLPFHQGVTNFGLRFPAHKTYCTIESRIAEVGDILFSVRAPVGRINITLEKIVIGRGLSAIRSNCGQQNFLFYSLKDYFFKEDMMGGGAIFAAITKKDLHGVRLLQPRDALVEMFQECVVPIDRQIVILHRMMDKLAQARDLLLARLMNEEIPI